MKDLGQVDKILGIRFTWEDDGITSDQEVYARQIFEEFGMSDCKPAATPISPSIQLDNDKSSFENQGA